MNTERTIEKLVFGILSPTEIKNMAVCAVDANNLYDERMGIISDDKTMCPTCNQTSKFCPGHFGYVELACPIIHPLYIKNVVQFLRCVCKTCKRLLFTKEQVLLKWGKGTGEAKFTKMSTLMKDVQICSHCTAQQPSVMLRETGIVFEHEHKIQGHKKPSIISVPVEITEIKRIFEEIKDEDVELMGFNPKLVRPINFIMTIFPVLPPCARPYIMSEGITCHDDLTNQTLEIIKDCKKLESEQDPKKKQKLYKSLEFHISTFYNNSKKQAKHPTTKTPIKCLKQRIAGGKEGQIRLNHMGKRVDFSARTVIGPDPTLRFGEIAIPKYFSEKLTFPERVNKYNINHLTNLINSKKASSVVKNNGQTIINLKYALKKRGTILEPCDIIISKSEDISKYKNNNNEYNVDEILKDKKFIRVVLRNNEEVKENEIVIRNKKIIETTPGSSREFILKEGDIVERHLKDGDWLLLNRQPTLHKGGMIGVKVKIRPYNTIRMNLCMTRSFNADFDGDEMNLHAPQNYQALAELKELSSTEQMFVSPQDSKNNICIIQDALLGAYLLTLGRVKINKEWFMNICMSGYSKSLQNLWSEKNMKKISSIFKKFNKDDDPYCGHGLISLILPVDFYYENNNKINNEEPTIKIYKGVMYEGTLDKSALGQVSNSIIHILVKDYGTEVASVFVDNIQFLVNEWLINRGFTIGLQDCIIEGGTSSQTIKQTLNEYYIKAQGIEETTKSAGIREIKLQNILSQAKDIGMRIAKDAMKPDNNFLSCVKSGAKGDFFNIAQITGLLGQQSIQGKRVLLQLNHKGRSLPHYPLYKEKMTKEREYESRGFASSSFIRGLNPREFFFHAMAGRDGICDTAMSTATSGYMQRCIGKLCEDIQVQYDATIRDTTGRIYQTAYSGTGYDPSQTMKVKNNQSICDVKRFSTQLNAEYEETDDELISKYFSDEIAKESLEKESDEIESDSESLESESAESDSESLENDEESCEESEIESDEENEENEEIDVKSENNINKPVVFDTKDLNVENLKQQFEKMF